MNRPLFRMLASAIAVIPLLVGCGSSSPVSYYSLDSLDPDYLREADGAMLIGVGPLRTPDYLTRSRIVTRGQNGEVYIDDFHRWVEPVDDAIYRIVSQRLDTMLEEAVVIAYPYTYVADMEYQLLGRIDRFDADQDGRVILQTQWAVATPSGDVLVRPKRAIYESRADSGRDYPSIARAMSDALVQFCRDVASEIEAALADGS